LAFVQETDAGSVISTTVARKLRHEKHLRQLVVRHDSPGTGQACLDFEYRKQVFPNTTPRERALRSIKTFV